LWESNSALLSGVRDGVDVTSRDRKNRVETCHIVGEPNLGDDYVVTTPLGGSRAVKPWYSLPYYVTLKELAATKPGTDFSGEESLYPPLPPNDGDVPLLKRVNTIQQFLELLPGRALILNVEDQKDEAVVVNFLNYNVAELLWFDGKVDRSKYKIDEDRICFDHIHQMAGAACASLAVEACELGHYCLNFTDKVAPPLVIRFLRPGRIASLQ
jgi:hypothetical protein